MNTSQSQGDNSDPEWYSFSQEKQGKNEKHFNICQELVYFSSSPGMREMTIKQEKYRHNFMMSTDYLN